MPDNVFCDNSILVHECIHLKKMTRKGIKYLNAKTVAWTKFWYEAEKVTIAKTIIGNLGLEKKYGRNWMELAKKDGYILYSKGDSYSESIFYIPSSK